MEKPICIAVDGIEKHIRDFEENGLSEFGEGVEVNYYVPSTEGITASYLLPINILYDEQSKIEFMEKLLRLFEDYASLYPRFDERGEAK